jgi:hypothetical protein
MRSLATILVVSAMLIAAGCSSSVQVRVTPLKDQQVDPNYQPVAGSSAGGNRGSSGSFEKAISDAKQQHDTGMQNAAELRKR